MNRIKRMKSVLTFNHILLESVNNEEGGRKGPGEQCLNQHKFLTASVVLNDVAPNARHINAP